MMKGGDNDLVVIHALRGAESWPIDPGPLQLLDLTP